MASTPGIKISSKFDCGNIEVIDASNPAAIRLGIRQDVTGRCRNTCGSISW
jgi:hypothetical protein